ncbi:MAG TPA: PAS domain-containing protein, partial [Vicinamibacteria bacterium]
MADAIRVLIAENDSSDAELVVRELRRAGFEPEWRRVETEEGYLRELTPDLDVILSDYSMPQFDGPRALELLQGRGLDVPFILVSGTVGEEAAVAAMKNGADDYLLKDRLTRLGAAVRHAIARRRERDRGRRAETELRRFVSASPAVIYARAVRDGAFEHLWTSENLTRLTGHLPAESRSTTWWTENIHPEDREAVVAAHRPPYTVDHLVLEYRFRRKDGTWLWIRDEKRLLRDEAGAPMEVVGSWVDLTERRRAEEWRAMQYRVTQALADSTSLAQAAPGIIQAVCETLGGRFGAVWEIDSRANLLRCSATWHEPGLDARELEAQTREISFASGKGMPGRAWASGRAVMVAQVAGDSELPRAEVALRAGLKAAFAFPILRREHVAGVVDFLGSDLREPEPELLAMLSAIGSQIGQFIEHRRAERQLLHAQK